MTIHNIHPDGDDVLLHVRVQPRASRTAIVAEPDGRIRVALTAPPVEGAANEALRQFMAKKLDIARNRVTVETGEKSREKTLRLTGLTEQDVRTALNL